MKGILGAAISFVLLVAAHTTVRAQEISLFAAASLKEVVNELAVSFSAGRAGVKVIRNLGASGALAKQIENGAPADIFISANLEWMDYLKAKNLLDGSRTGIFATNLLVFVGTGEGRVSGMEDLARLERIAVGSPRSVPAGEYAVEAMKKAGVFPSLESRLVMARDVRECLMYAERGEVDGAFVYRTDALQAKQARILFVVPAGLHTPIVYPMAMTATGMKNREAQEFFSFLQGREARKVLAKFGFTI